MLSKDTILNSAKNEEKIEKRHLMMLKYLNGY